MTGASVMTNSRVVHSQRQASPILRIPCEITSEIFQHCLPENEFPEPTVISAPIQLSHVCSAWRKLAIRTPRLWSKILLSSTHDFEVTNGSFPANMESQVEALVVWMSRATPLLLSVHLRYPTLPELPFSKVKTDKLPPVFRIIVNNARRWKDVKMSLPPSYLSYAWTLIPKKASNLENFDINDTSIPWSDHAVPVHLRADTAGTLSTLSVRALPLHNPSATPFMNLRTLSLKHSFPAYCLPLLRDCPVLEDLTLHYYDLRHDPRAVGHPILLSRLHTFRLSHTGDSADGTSSLAAGGEVGILLDCLELPNLRDFYLWTTILGYERDEDHELPWDYLSRLITRSNCSLQELELRAAYMDNSSILKCVQLSPDLKYVGIPWDKELEYEVRKSLPGLRSLRMFDGLAKRVISQRFTLNFTF